MEIGMKNTHKKIAIAGITVSIAASILTGCKINSDTPILGSIFGLGSDKIFQVGDMVCSKDEYKLLFMNYVNEYKADFGSDFSWDSKIDGETTFKEYVMEKAKEDISIKYTIAAMAETENVKIDEEDSKIINETADNYYNSLSEEDIEYANADADLATVLYTNYYLANKVYNKVTEKAGDDISEEDARVVKIQYVKMSTDNNTEKKIKSTYRKLQKQVKNLTINFAQEAKQITEDDTVELVIKKNEASSKLEKEAFNVNYKTTSSIIKDGKNYYLIYCVDNYLKEETQKNRLKMVEEEKEKVFKKEYDEFVKDLDYDFNTSQWEDIIPEDTDGTSTDAFFELLEQM
jgi:foldase protein PrsA